MPGKSGSDRRRLTPGVITAVYLVLGTVWIVGGGYAVAVFGAGEMGFSRHALLEMGKGLAFVLTTGVLLHVLTRRMSGDLESSVSRAEANEARYRTLFDGIPEPAWMYDDATMGFLAVNTAAVLRYGWSREEFAGMTLADIRPAGDVRALLESHHTAPEAWHDAGIFRHKTRDGRVFPVRITAQPVVSEGRKAWLVVASDMSEVVSAREELVKANKALEAANETLEQRVEERTRRLRRSTTELEWFGETVSQDLRAPMAHVRVMATELARSAGERLTPDELELAHRLVGAAARTSNLVEELLAYARSGGMTEGDQGETVSLVLALSEIAGQLERERPVTRGKVRLIEPMYWTRAPKPVLARVLYGLLKLATEGGDGGPVVVRAERADGAVRLVIECDDRCIDEHARTAMAATTSAVGEDGPRLPRTSGLALIARSAWAIGGALGYEPVGDGRGRLVLQLPYDEP